MIYRSFFQKLDKPHAMLGEEDGVIGVAFFDEVGLAKMLDDVVDAAVV